jgi:hypothetical protein
MRSVGRAYSGSLVVDCVPDLRLEDPSEDPDDALEEDQSISLHYIVQEEVSGTRKLLKQRF